MKPRKGLHFFGSLRICGERHFDFQNATLTSKKIRRYPAIHAPISFGSLFLLLTPVNRFSVQLNQGH